MGGAHVTQAPVVECVRVNKETADSRESVGEDRRRWVMALCKL